MKKLTVAEQEALFTKDCKLINLQYEYSGFTGKEEWAIITELTEKELSEKFSDIIDRYKPFILLSMEQGEVIAESKKNNDKYEKRAFRTLDAYSYEDDIFEQFHKETIVPFVDPFEEAEEEKIEIEKEIERIKDIKKARKVLEMMKPIQRDRLMKTVVLGMSSRKIAVEEGVNYSSVDKSIVAAIKSFKKFYEKL